MGNKGQGDANDTNRQISRDQMAFQERMSNSEYQRSANDLRMAGMNPMLSLMKGGGASTPPGASTHVESTTKDAANSANSLIPILFNMMLQREQTAKTAAEADKTKAEATMAQNEATYSGENAFNKKRILDREAHLIGTRVDIAMRDLDVRNLEVEQLKKLQPLAVEYQRLVNKAQSLDLPEKEALAKFWDKVPEAKWMQIIKELLPALNLRRK